MLPFWLLSLSPLLIVQAKAKSKCSAFSEQTVSECLQPMLSYASKLQEKTGAMQFPIQGVNIFKRLCNIYLEFQDCTTRIDCRSLSIEAVDASYGYMCGTGYKLFEQHAACFAQVEVEPAYIDCKERASSAIAQSQSQRTDGQNEQYLGQLCRVMDQYLRCSRPVINRQCGASAWQLVSRVTSDSLGVTMPDCDMHNALR